MRSSSKRDKKIALLASTLVTGGAEEVIRALATGLPAFGFDPHVVCLRGPGTVGVRLRENGVTVHHDLMRSRFDPYGLVRLLRILNAERSAVLFTLDHHDALFAGALASMMAGIAHRVVGVHSTGLWNRRGSFRFSDRLIFPLYGTFVALARAHADYLVQREGVDRRRIRIVNNGVDTTRFSPSAHPGGKEDARRALSLPISRFVVVIVAVLRPEKNHEMLLRAAAMIRRTEEDLLVLVVGGGPEEDRLRRMSRELDLGETVRFLGIRGDIPDILRASDVSVLCSHPVVETFPLSILEAMASGLPVVATSVGSIPEMVEDGREGILVATGDVDALAAAIVRLKRSEEERRSMGGRARERVLREFSERHMVRGYAELFEELVAGGDEGQPPR